MRNTNTAESLMAQGQHGRQAKCDAPKSKDMSEAVCRGPP